MKSRICEGGVVSDFVTSSNNFTMLASMKNGSVRGKKDVWISLFWFDWAFWAKEYQAGNCYDIKQIQSFGNEQKFGVCMRRNVTEKLVKDIHMKTPPRSRKRAFKAGQEQCKSFCYTKKHSWQKVEHL